MIKTEMELFIEHAQKVHNYHVLDFYHKSWLPLKADRLREMATKETLTDTSEDV